MLFTSSCGSELLSTWRTPFGTFCRPGLMALHSLMASLLTSPLLLRLVLLDRNFLATSRFLWALSRMLSHRFPASMIANEKSAVDLFEDSTYCTWWLGFFLWLLELSLFLWLLTVWLWRESLNLSYLEFVDLLGCLQCFSSDLGRF